MDRKIKWLLVILAGAFVFWFLYGQDKAKKTTTVNNNDSLKTSKQPQVTPKPDTLSQSERVSSSQPDSEVQSQSVDEKLEQWLVQIQDRRYSEDPTVEVSSLAMEFESCGNNNNDWLFTDKEPNEKQLQIKNLMDKHCKQLSADYPLLGNKENHPGLQIILHQFSTSTALGDYLQANQFATGGRLHTLEFSKGLLPLALKEKNAQMINMAEWISSFHIKNRLFEEQLIKGEHYEYLRSIQSIALTGLSCEFQDGITCSPSSRFMQDKCFDEEKFCGLDFKQWYQQAVSPGMDADIQILKTYFQGLVQP
ncbi:MAG: hypothetical protein KDI92_05855 [Xanthomonadales bacterium]|nr:hypothetical protein [Xanthomonadales bacterium]